jgi:hypothetical protein
MYSDEMTKYLMSQKPTVINIEKYEKLPMIFLKNKSKENFNDLPFISLTGNTYYNSNTNNGGDQMINYLSSQKPTVLHKEVSSDSGAFSNIEYFTEEIMIPPLNTDIRFSAELPLLTSPEEISQSHPFMAIEDSNLYNEVYPWMESGVLYGDTKKYLPREIDYNHRHKTHPSDKPHVHENIQENFSWAIPTNLDTPLDLIKKSLIHEVSTQWACGSCWAVCTAETMSDCFVVSGAVGWAPDISSTFLMASIPFDHNMCGGGNPAAIIPFLEKNGVADSSCIDYSWCSGDSKICTSVSSQSHFDAKSLVNVLNSQIPKNPYGCYYDNVKKWLYKLDPGTNVFYINEKAPIDVFRNTVRSHILDYGPVIGGFAVLKNFYTNFHKINGGVYFDRADYSNSTNGNVKFSDSISHGKPAGLHAVSIVGFGVAKNIQYDNNKFGDVPYWHCRNSWGAKWGDKGFFKMAMYPFNKISQFDKQVMTDVGGPIGSLILIRATKSPKPADLKKISQQYLNNIKRQKSDKYYKANPEEVRLMNRANLLDIDIDNVNEDILRHEIETDNNKKINVNKQNKMWMIVILVTIIILFVIYITK